MEKCSEVEDSVLQLYTIDNLFKETTKMKLQIKPDSEVSNLSTVRMLCDLELVPSFSELQFPYPLNGENGIFLIKLL